MTVCALTVMESPALLEIRPSISTFLVVIGEGNDGGSSMTFADVLSAAKAGHVQCFALLVANHRSQVGRVRQFGFDLYRLASATHGKAYDVRTDPELLDAALGDLLARLAANY